MKSLALALVLLSAPPKYAVQPGYTVESGYNVDVAPGPAKPAFTPAVPSEAAKPAPSPAVVPIDPDTPLLPPSPAHGTSGACACKVCDCIVCVCGEPIKDKGGAKILPATVDLPPSVPAETIKVAQTSPNVPRGPCTCTDGPTCGKCGGVVGIAPPASVFVPGLVIPPKTPPPAVVVVAPPAVARMADATGQVWTHPDGIYLSSWIAQRNAQTTYAPAQGYSSGAACANGQCGAAAQGYYPGRRTIFQFGRMR